MEMAFKYNRSELDVIDYYIAAEVVKPNFTKYEEVVDIYFDTVRKMNAVSEFEDTLKGVQRNIDEYLKLFKVCKDELSKIKSMEARQNLLIESAASLERPADIKANMEREKIVIEQVGKEEEVLEVLLQSEMNGYTKYKKNYDEKNEINRVITEIKDGIGENMRELSVSISEIENYDDYFKYKNEYDSINFSSCARRINRKVMNDELTEKVLSIAKKIFEVEEKQLKLKFEKAEELVVRYHDKMNCKEEIKLFKTLKNNDEVIGYMKELLADGVRAGKLNNKENVKGVFKKKKPGKKTGEILDTLEKGIKKKVSKKNQDEIIEVLDKGFGYLKNVTDAHFKNQEGKLSSYDRTEIVQSEEVAEIVNGDKFDISNCLIKARDTMLVIPKNINGQYRNPYFEVEKYVVFNGNNEKMKSEERAKEMLNEIDDEIGRGKE